MFTGVVRFIAFADVQAAGSERFARFSSDGWDTGYLTKDVQALDVTGEAPFGGGSVVGYGVSQCKSLSLITVPFYLVRQVGSLFDYGRGPCYFLFRSFAHDGQRYDIFDVLSRKGLAISEIP